MKFEFGSYFLHFNNMYLLFFRGKEKMPCERFLQGFRFSRAFFPPVSHGKKRGKFQNRCAHKAGVLIFSHLNYYFRFVCYCDFNVTFLSSYYWLMNKLFMK